MHILATITGLSELSKRVERYKVGTGHVGRIWRELEKGNGGKYYISLFMCMKFSTIKKNYNLKNYNLKK